ncbi:hypothetical protein LTS08_005330 [Lithohypha guttulata]|nr:hypothetical protein LTS08_005330 [Lithohypha guttulata]
MVELDHFDVHIIQDDQPAKEHLDSQAEETATSATRYAEIREDKNFEIRLTVKETFRLDDFDALSVEITFDGEHAGALCYPKAHFTLGKPYTDSVAGFSKLVDGKTIMKNFHFAETATRHVTSDEQLDDLRERFKDQGSIRVEISRVSGYSFIRTENDEEDNQDKRYPKSLVKENGSTSKASFTTTEKHEIVYTFATTKEESPMATFCFKYRTIGKFARLTAEYPGETIVIEDDMDVAAENERLKQEVGELRARVKKEEAEDYRNTRQRKRKRLEVANGGEVEMIDERPATRRKPASEDEVVVLED